MPGSSNRLAYPSPYRCTTRDPHQRSRFDFDPSQAESLRLASFWCRVSLGSFAAMQSSAREQLFCFFDSGMGTGRKSEIRNQNRIVIWSSSSTFPTAQLSSQRSTDLHNEGRVEYEPEEGELGYIKLIYSTTTASRKSAKNPSCRAGHAYSLGGSMLT